MESSQIQSACNERALAYIAQSQDPRELIALSESLRLGRSSCLYADDDGVVVRVTTPGDYLVGARDGTAAARLLACVGPTEQTGDVIALQDASWAAAVGFAPDAPLAYQICVYEGSEPIPVRGTLRIAPLTVDDLAVVCDHYKNLPEDFIARHLADGWMYGGYTAANELVGFVGEHDEGAIGMLEVFEAHRRRGYGWELEGFLINQMLKAGRVPFTQVVVGNEPSFALHRKLGFSVLPRVQCWNW